MARKPKLPSEVQAALAAVVEYGWDAELEDAREHLRENGDLDGHAFANLVIIDNWLNGTDRTPESHVEDGPIR
jgi:hypothetical protein